MEKFASNIRNKPESDYAGHKFQLNGSAASSAQKGFNLSLKPPAAKLKYEVDSWSSHSASYHPRNVMVNKPQDQSSRWSSGSNNQMQFITLRLEKMAIVQTITFGKYHKVHVCNLKEFKVFGGQTPDNMIEILHSGLRNDSEPETFTLKYKGNNIVFPCKYIKIVPLVAWGQNFNYSIWYVELRGNDSPVAVEKAYNEYIKVGCSLMRIM